MILIISLLLTISLTQKCNHYTCDIDNSKVDTSKWVCMNSTIDPTTITPPASINFLVRLSQQGCPKGMECDYSFSESNDTCVAFINNTRAPGEACIENNHCYSGNCKAGVCVGDPVNSACTFDMECDIHLACGAGVCSPVVAVGGACDNEATKCSPKLACNLGKCVNPGSIESGQPADNPFACKSFYIAPISTGATTYACTKGPTLNNGKADGALTPCPESGNCVYSFTLKDGTKSTYTQMCDCGRSSQDLLYCPLGKGDFVNETAIYLSFAGNTSYSDCHISKGVFCNTTKAWDNTTYMAYYAFMNIVQQTYYDSQETCMKNINGHYFKGREIYEEFIQYHNTTPPSAAFGMTGSNVWIWSIIVILVAALW